LLHLRKVDWGEEFWLCAADLLDKKYVSAIVAGNTMENKQDPHTPLEIANEATCRRDEETIDRPTPPPIPTIYYCRLNDCQKLTEIELENVCSG
jgi:hypothetical protein